MITLLKQNAARRQSRDSWLRRAACLVILAILATLATGCLLAPATTGGQTTETVDTLSSATLARYRTNEIQEYEGMLLDPAVGPRDNSIKGVQQVDMGTYRLMIDGLVKGAVELSYEDVLKMESVDRLITLHCVEGWDATILWRGVQLSTLIGLAEADPIANTVIFHCVDGYTTSLPLQAIVENKLILAYEANGLALPPEMGYPFIVVAEEKLGYKWARWVEQIEISADVNFLGYWESLGYDNGANLK